MHRIYLLTLAGALCSAIMPAMAEPLTPGERDFAVNSMGATRKLFLESIAGLSPEQWNFKAAPERWSIAECAEHIALSEDLISTSAKRVLTKEAQPDKAVRGDAARPGDQKLLELITDRSDKAQAPEPLKPKQTFATPQEAVDHFKKSRDANIDFIQKTQDDLRAHIGNGPADPFDAYRAFLLMSAHTERHTKQINEVKADLKFPN